MLLWKSIITKKKKKSHTHSWCLKQQSFFRPRWRTDVYNAGFTGLICRRDNTRRCVLQCSGEDWQVTMKINSILCLALLLLGVQFFSLLINYLQLLFHAVLFFALQLLAIRFLAFQVLSIYIFYSFHWGINSLLC